MNLLLKIIGIVIVVIGASVVYGAKIIMGKTNFAEKQTIKIEEIEEEKLAELKEYKAIATIKIYGAFVFLVGLILTVLAFN